MNSEIQGSRSAPGFAGRVARAFLDSKLTPLFIITSLMLGVAAAYLLPREEEPQIRVPMIDVMVSLPGFEPKEVEEMATVPMEKLLWEIPGVEYIYSTSSPGRSLVIVRFKVGEDVEKSLVKLNQKLQSNFDRIPPGVSFPLIKPKSIDDVPILALTFHSARQDSYTLRRLVVQLDEAIKQVPQVAETTILGGVRRQVRVLLDPARLASRHLSPLELVPRLQQANSQALPGDLTSQNQAIVLQTGGFLKSAEDVGNVVVGVYGERPVYLRDVADIVDGPAEPSDYVLYGEGVAASALAHEEPAVTLTIAKRPAANAITVVDAVLRKVRALQDTFIPADVQMTVTRDYGRSAAEKSNELLLHMGIAVVSVAFLILLALGWREAGVVIIAIPCTLALTLLVFYLYPFTLNRVTLFALIFSIGILVDDAIVVVDNIARHLRLPQSRGRNWREVAVEAVDEVGNPTILATFAVIAAVLPMAMVGGMMGPYMRPIPIGATAAMLFSLAISFVITPWASVRLLRWRRGASPGGEPAGEAPAARFGLLARVYRAVMRPLIAHRCWRYGLLALLGLLLLGALALVGIGWVQVKMLPFDNKSEFDVVLNMPEGSSLEETAGVAREMAAAVRQEREVLNYQVYVGIPAPVTFNGLVRHYYLRRGAHYAEVHINLVGKSQRHAQSHAIAQRVRPRVAAIAAKYRAHVAVVEIPPGPPVLETLVAEVYGPSAKDRLALARQVLEVFEQTPGVVDADWYVQANQPKARFIIDKEKAALNGISTEAISQTLAMVGDGQSAGLLHVAREKEPVELWLQAPRRDRSRPEDLLALKVASAQAPAPAGAASPAPPRLVPLLELVRIERTVIDQSIYRKNLMPVTYVVGDVAKVIQSPVYAILKMDPLLRRLKPAEYGGTEPVMQINNYDMPFTENQPVIKWDGEWHITIEVFRDLGLAFAAVLVLIYVLMVGWFRSFVTPLIVMVVIPFSLVGILPAHGLLHAFFTATSMIGFMAGAGIVVRNSIILVDFIELRLAEGMPLAEAVVDAGLVRFRPIMLTALAVVVGASVILSDPIFQGLAISLMAGWPGLDAGQPHSRSRALLHGRVAS